MEQYKKNALEYAVKLIMDCKRTISNSFDNVSIILTLDVKYPKGGYFRHKVYNTELKNHNPFNQSGLENGYKGNRKKSTDERIHEVLPFVIDELVKRFQHIGFEGLEADDIMFFNSIAIQKHNELMEMQGTENKKIKHVILSRDRDLWILLKYGVKFHNGKDYIPAVQNRNSQLVFGGPWKMEKGKITAMRKDNVPKSIDNGLSISKVIQGFSQKTGKYAGEWEAIPNFHKLKPVKLQLKLERIYGKHFCSKHFHVNKSLVDFDLTSYKTHIGEDQIKMVMEVVCDHVKVENGFFQKPNYKRLKH